nr:SET domain-containing protein SmydA-8-like isoform X2 [Procambarus clarkii]
MSISVLLFPGLSKTGLEEPQGKMQTICCPKAPNLWKNECSILAGSGAKIKIDKVESVHPAYECITPLRCLLLKETDPKKWETINQLQDHINNIKNSEMDAVIKRNTIDYLKNYIKYNGAESSEIYRMCGILLINSFELKHNGQRVRGIYPQAAMMAHDCIPNTKHAFDDDLTLILRATVVIRKGNPITSTYTNILWNTLQRRKQLQVTKHFLCTCRRCSDPKELGTHLSTLLCSECGAHMWSTAPLDNDASWSCQKCPNTILGKTVSWGDQILYKELCGVDQHSARQLEEFLENYKKALHPKHRFFMEAKYALVKFYGNHPEHRYRDMTREQLERKVEYCHELLELAGIIDPGLSLFRGTLLFELQGALVAQARLLLSNDVITKEGTQDYMTEAVKYLKEASEILKQEPEMEKGGLDAKLKVLSEELDI